MQSWGLIIFRSSAFMQVSRNVRRKIVEEKPLVGT